MVITASIVTCFRVFLIAIYYCKGIYHMLYFTVMYQPAGSTGHPEEVWEGMKTLTDTGENWIWCARGIAPASSSFSASKLYYLVLMVCKWHYVCSY